jgi:hypothetical protein
MTEETTRGSVGDPDGAATAVATPRTEREPASAEGDAADHLEDLITEAAPPVRTAAEEGLAIEIVGPHLRVSGRVQLGYHRRLSDFINNHQGLVVLHDATVLRRNGDPTRVFAPSIWINLDDVTLVGQLVDDRPVGAGASVRMERRPHTIIAVTQGHTLTGDVHLAPEAMLAGFVESPDPRFIPMTEVRTRSLADRRVITRYAFALLNRRHIVAATALQAGMIRGRGAI